MPSGNPRVPKTEQWRKNISLAIKAKYNSDLGYRMRVTEGTRKAMANPEIRNKISQSLKTRFETDLELKKWISQATREAMVELKSDPVYREKVRARNIKINSSPSTREKRRLISRRLVQDPNYIAKITPNDETKAKISQKVLELYRSDPDYRRRVLSNRRPTDIEERLIKIINEYRLPYKYTGDGSFWIGGKNPDFVNINSGKIAIDLFGDFWHEPSEVESRKSAFADFGWQLIILWGHELKCLKDSELATRIAMTEGES
jgi:hypothetical protein